MRIEKMPGSVVSLKPLIRILPTVLILLPFLACADSREPGAAVVISVRDHGAKGDGSGDDSAAFQAAFELAAGLPHSIVRIPAGVYRLERRVSVRFEGGVDKGLAIVGDGQGVSVIRCANEDGALYLYSERCQTQVTLRDLTLVAEIPGAGTALEVFSPSRGVRNYRTLTVENVDIRGAGLPTRSYFKRGLTAIGQWRPLFRNVIFCGVLDPSLKDEAERYAELRFKPEWGFCADWCYAPVFQHCYAWSCHTGYRVVSRDRRPEGPEDAAFHRCNAVGTKVGIDIDTPIIEPQLVIDSCHLNCQEVGLRLANRKFFHIINCLFYTKDEDRFPYTDIELKNCWAGLIQGNMFHSPHPKNMRADPPSKRVCIDVDERTKHVKITGNTFNGKGVAFQTAPGALGIRIDDNQIINRHVKVPDAPQQLP
ncbi:MAG: hypothetical protein KAJ19_00360 [Gammaproteobacteria bacterium]|nr:hypothetical protein [Gammaproteobacteria bacterium]